MKKFTIVDKEQRLQIAELTEKLHLTLEKVLSEDEKELCYDEIIIGYIDKEKIYIKPKRFDVEYPKQKEKFMKGEYSKLTIRDDIQEQTLNLISECKQRYKNSLGNGAIIIKELKDTISSI
ncbi:MAG: hypothetical protein IKF82_00385 [Bacilli bacterium]|nr:hypothetical protein [Bacilli bacterium]